MPLLLSTFPSLSVLARANSFCRQIHNAAQHPVQLDMAQSNAVEARTLLDLRIGAAFTRLQTLQLQGRFDQLKNDVISYG